ncbi:MAG: response regulator [Gammaproteobacteria bacterium]|nr:response regulator [Gammaproteobacteria bacterium]
MALWSLKGKKILTVDDFPGMRSMLRTMLTTYGATDITEATNGIDAIRLLAMNTYDIVLCDYNLGEGKDGQQILEEAKHRELIPYSTVYIMTTAENTSEMVMGAVEYQPDDYLSKPFTKQVLIARLKRLVERKSILKNLAISAQQRDYARACEYCDELLEKASSNRYEIIKIKGELLLKLKRYEDASTLYTTILNERELPWAKLGLGQCFFHLEKYDDARFCLEEIIETHPNYVFAHDWLADVHKVLGNPKKSQRVLHDAVKKSPKAILRQQKLAITSFENTDYDASENAYKRIVRIGKYSCYRSPKDFLGLAKVYFKKGKIADALKVISNMKKEFRTAQPNDRMLSGISEVFLYHEMHRENETRVAIANVLAQFKADPSTLSSEDAMAVARICYQLDMHREGDTFIQHVVRNNHDNQPLLAEVRELLTECGVSQETLEMINQTRDEVISINNQGVELATNGDLEESISLFNKAASAMPENNIINLNAAQSLIMFINKSKPQEDLLDTAHTFLSRVRFDGAPSKKYLKLIRAYRRLQAALPNDDGFTKTSQ